MITTINLVNICYLIQKQGGKTEKKRKKFLLVMRTFRICSFSNFQIYHTVVLTIVIMMYIASPILIYLITVSLYLLTTFVPFAHPSPPASGNHKSDLFYYEFGDLGGLGFFRFHK